MIQVIDGVIEAIQPGGDIMETLINLSMAAPIRIVCGIVFFVTILRFMWFFIAVPHGEIENNVKNLKQSASMALNLFLPGFAGALLGGIAFILTFISIRLLFYVVKLIPEKSPSAEL